MWDLISTVLRIHGTLHLREWIWGPKTILRIDNTSCVWEVYFAFKDPFAKNRVVRIAYGLQLDEQPLLTTADFRADVRAYLKATQRVEGYNTSFSVYKIIQTLDHSSTVSQTGNL